LLGGALGGATVATADIGKQAAATISAVIMQQHLAMFVFIEWLTKHIDFSHKLKPREASF
jgi:hypothetical protein